MTIMLYRWELSNDPLVDFKCYFAVLFIEKYQHVERFFHSNVKNFTVR
jgi:hypothetical protein